MGRGIYIYYIYPPIPLGIKNGLSFKINDLQGDFQKALEIAKSLILMVK